MKKHSLFILSVLGFANAFSQTFSNNNFSFQILDEEAATVEITKGILPKYGGHDVTIPATVTYNDKEYKITEIADNAFQNMEVWSVYAGNSNIEKIGANAFNRCKELSTVKMSDALKSVGASAFQNCYALYDINLGPNVETIGQTAFQNCIRMIYIELPDALTSLGAQAYAGCKGAWSIRFGKSLKTLSGSNFEDCTGLKSVSLPNTLESISNSPFKGCTNLTEIKIPNSVTSIDRYAFENLTGIKKIDLPESLTVLGYGAFRGCSNLSSIEIPAKVKVIGEQAFKDCENLSSINIPANINTIGREAYSGCIGLTSLFIPATVRKIDNGAFLNCWEVSSVTMYGNTEVGQKAFAGCRKLTKYYSMSTTVPKVADVDAFTSVQFDGVDGNVPTLYVPASVRDDYFIAYGWNLFQEVIGMGSILADVTPETMHLDIREVKLAKADIHHAEDIEIVAQEWVSDNPEVALADKNGRITGLKDGLTCVRLMIENNFGLVAEYGKILVAVGNVDINLKLDKTELTMNVDESYSLKIDSEGTGYEITGTTWNTSNPDVAVVDVFGGVTALAEGEATISASVVINNVFKVDLKCQLTVKSGAGINETYSDGLVPEYYTIQGDRISGDNLKRGVYVRRIGGKTDKILVR